MSGGFKWLIKDIQWARLWIKLTEAKTLLNNELLPLLEHLEETDADPNLNNCLEAANRAIAEHLQNFRLQASSIKTGVLARELGKGVR